MTKHEVLKNISIQNTDRRTSKPRDQTTVLASAAVHSQHKPAEAILVYIDLFPGLIKPQNINPPKPKSPAPRRSERFIMFVCQLLPPSCSKSHRIPASVGPAPEWKGLQGAPRSAGPHGGQPQQGLPGFSPSSPAATSAEFAPLSLVCAQAARNLLGAGPPWS